MIYIPIGIFRNKNIPLTPEMLQNATNRNIYIVVMLFSIYWKVAEKSNSQIAKAIQKVTIRKHYVALAI